MLAGPECQGHWGEGEGVITKVASSRQGSGEQRYCGSAPPHNILCPQAVELMAFKALGRATPLRGFPFPPGHLDDPSPHCARTFQSDLRSSHT